LQLRRAPGSPIRSAPPRTREHLAALFGPAFAQAVFARAPGQWSAPLPSTDGPWMVLVEERLPERTMQLDEARPALVEDLRRQRQDAQVRALVAQLRDKYDVSPAGPP
jgi:parvulin-like peptidyl-prolyl isomerase